MAGTFLTLLPILFALLAPKKGFADQFAPSAAHLKAKCYTAPVAENHLVLSLPVCTSINSKKVLRTTQQISFAISVVLLLTCWAQMLTETCNAISISAKPVS